MRVTTPWHPRCISPSRDSRRSAYSSVRTVRLGSADPQQRGVHRGARARRRATPPSSMPGFGKSTGVSPVHRYQRPGVYSICLMSIDAAGARASATARSAVKSQNRLPRYSIVTFPPRVSGGATLFSSPEAAAEMTGKSLRQWELVSEEVTGISIAQPWPGRYDDSSLLGGHRTRSRRSGASTRYQLRQSVARLRGAGGRSRTDSGGYCPRQRSFRGSLRPPASPRPPGRT